MLNSKNQTIKNAIKQHIESQSTPKNSKFDRSFNNDSPLAKLSDMDEGEEEVPFKGTMPSVTTEPIDLSSNTQLVDKFLNATMPTKRKAELVEVSEKETSVV